MSLHRSIASVLVALAALLSGLLTAPPSPAQESDSGPALLLILDASGSMNRVDENGVKLIDGAQDALVRLVESLPEGLTVGLRVYGHRVPNTDKRNGCTDTELIVPPGPLNREEMSEAIRSFPAKGYTPIGLSLQEAAADLDPVEGGTIVLVSDGEDTCAPPPPCDVARDLIADGYRIQVHSVGFLLEEGSPARDELQCIAEETGGSYGEVYEIDFLTTQVGRIISEAIPEGQNYHIPFDGAVMREEAPVLPLFEMESEQWRNALGGLYDTRIRPGETRWFAVDLGEGRDIDVGSGIWPDFFVDVPEGEAFEILIVDADGKDVRVPSPVRQPWRVEVVSVVDWETAGMAAFTRTEIFLWEHLDDESRRNAERQGFTQETYEQWIRDMFWNVTPEPLPAGRYYIGLAWDSTRPPDADISLGFSVFAEMVDYTEFQLRDRIRLPGGASVDQAPDLALRPFDPFPFPAREGDPGASRAITTPISAGETLWYRLHLEWDEDLHVGAFLHRPLNTPTAPGETFSVRIYGPIAQAEGPDAPGAEINPGQPGALIPLDDPSALEHDEPAWLPRPHARATSAYLGTESPPPQGWEGTHYMAITWDSTIGDFEAEVEFVADRIWRCPAGCGDPPQAPVRPEPDPEPQPEPEPPPPEPIEIAPAVSVVAEATPDTETDDGGADGAAALQWIVAAAVVVSLAVGGWIGRRRRISAGGS